MKQDRQCMCNALLRHVSINIVATNEIYITYSECVCVCVCVCVCSPSYSACKAYVPYFHCGLSGSTIFFHIIA